uniref:Lung seven transmembrane receptor family protein n=1 Tax=Syphacia muris TaxID=451379 RepID=A0A0N5AW21_9BILA
MAGMHCAMHDVRGVVMFFYFINVVFLLFITVPTVYSHFLTPAITTTVLDLKGDPSLGECVAFPRSALNGTEFEIRLKCNTESKFKFVGEFVIRSSPCDKEFFDVRRHEKVNTLLNSYFKEEYGIPAGYDYKKFLFYRSKEKVFDCSNGAAQLFDELPDLNRMTLHTVKQTFSSDKDDNDDRKRVKRGVYPGLNGDSIDGGVSNSLSSWHPCLTLPADGIYFLILKLHALKGTEQQISQSISVELQWRGPYGYLSAIDYPLLRFYAVMCVVYTLLAISWLAMCLKHWKDILRIQYWIGAVIAIGMLEKGMFYSEYATMNNVGTSVGGFIEAAELVSCLKRTMSRILVIIVSVGYGVVRPRLGSTLNEVAAVGFIHFIFSAVEALTRVSKTHAEGIKQKQLASLPLVIVEVIIFWWVFTSIINTMRTLRVRRNEVKLAVYRHFTNALCFAVTISAVFMMWTIYIHNFQKCLTDWKEYWVDIAFWHVLFCSILIVIMILWRPSQNNQRYAFTPLLDDSENENDDDELFNSSFYAKDFLNQRISNSESKIENRKEKETAPDDEKIQEELKWIEEHIPSTIADKLLVDDDEDRERVELERSKLL